MINFFNKFKIPTLLGLSLILLGLGSGLYLVLREQVFLSQAAPDLTPQNITITNITDESAVISWQTKVAAASFITFGPQNPREQTVLDDRDTGGPKPHLTHYVTLKNLLPNTSYSFKITSGKIISEIIKFDTATPAVNQTGFNPVIGSVMDGNNPLNDGVAYLSIQDATVQSSLVKTGGNFLISISQIRKTDLKDVFPLTEGVIAKLTILSDKGGASVRFRLHASASPLPAVKLGQDIDLTVPAETPAPSPSDNLDKYDLNGDRKINTTDYALATSCFGKDPATNLAGGRTCAKADINGDGKIDQKDLDLMSQKLKTLGSQ